VLGFLALVLFLPPHCMETEEHARERRISERFEAVERRIGVAPSVAAGPGVGVEADERSLRERVEAIESRLDALERRLATAEPERGDAPRSERPG
jgi:hypothetical protein